MTFTVPNTFIAGTKAKATEVNENFSSIASEIDVIEADVTELETEVALKEDVGNKVTSFQETPDDVHYPTEKLLKDSLDNISGTPIGTVIPLNCTADYVPDGCLPCDGAEYTKEQFSDLWDSYLTATTPLLNTCSYETYTTEITTYGQCGKFALDTISEKFKVPTLKDGTIIQQAMQDSELSKAYNAGLPNITGGLRSVDDFTIGAFTYTAGGSVASGTNIPTYTKWLDASRSSSIYGNSTTVQPNAIALRYFIVVANGQINQSQMDWSAWASSLQGKVNKDGTNLTTTTGTGGVRAVVDAYINGASWYRVWSDGWIEQGGRFTGFNTAITITFLKPFSNTYYAIQQGEIGRAGADPYINGVFYTSLTKTSVVANMHNDGTNTYMWYACGY